MTKARLSTANISANAVSRTRKRSICLKGQQPNCEGQLKRLTRTELSKYRENKLAFKNFHNQMKAPYVIYADFKCLQRKIQKGRKLLAPAQYKGEDALYVLLAHILEEERRMHAYMAKKKSPVSDYA